MTGEPYGHRRVADAVAVGWAVPSRAWSEQVRPGPVDAARAAALAPERRQAFLTGRAVLARLLDQLFPGSPAWSVDTAACPDCGAGHGPVAVRGVPALASVAHADGLAVVALAPTGRVSRIGVDVEPDRPASQRARELAVLQGTPVVEACRRWTRVQAVVKAGGHGLRLDPGLVRFGPGSGRVEGAPTTYELRDVAGPAGYALSVAWSPVRGLR